jgi:hypothetical protein
MEHSWAEYHRHHEEQGNAGIERVVDDPEQLSLAQSANES